MTSATKPTGWPSRDRPRNGTSACRCLTSYEAAGGRPQRPSRHRCATRPLLLLGMGGSHAVGRAVEPLYRALGIDAIAVPLSEQLGEPLVARRPHRADHIAIGRKRRSGALVRETGGNSGHVRPDAGRGSFLARTATIACRRGRHRACLRRHPQPDRQLRASSRHPRSARRGSGERAWPRSTPEARYRTGAFAHWTTSQPSSRRAAACRASLKRLRSG
jgi:hypothetical protein